MPATYEYDDLIMIPMRDGIRVAASIWRPDDGRPHPAILMRSLGRRNRSSRLTIIEEIVASGYAFVSSDIRGRFESEGTWDPTDSAQEGRDGYDTIEWMAAQPWCDGNIGTFGASHMAGYQVAAAMEHPPHLKAIATWTGGIGGSSGTGGSKPPRAGGAMSLITTLIWLPNEAMDALRKLEEAGEDVAEARRILARMRTHPEETFNHLPLREVPIAQFGKLRELLEWRLSATERPADSGFSSYAQIDVPVFHECGWYDPVAWNQFEGFNGMREHGGSGLAREGQHIVAGPWQHALVFHDRLGDMFFGLESDNAGSGINRLQIRFYDKYVRNMDVDLPRIRYFVMGVNEWRTAEAWPPPKTSWQRFYLRSGGGANSASGDGGLSLEAPGEERSDSFIYDPEMPVPTLGGNFIGMLSVPGMIPGPIDQAPIEKRQDVLCYTTEPFRQDTEVSGPLALHLSVSTSAVDTDFTARLTHVYADGRSFNLGEGIIRLSGRSLASEKEPVIPGEIYKVSIAIGQTSLVVRRGERLRLQVSSSNFPQFDRNMNTGNRVGTDAHGIRALQTVHHHEGLLSYIDLPVVSA